MVYESDFYTTRRSYRTSPSLTSYTVSKREIPWEKVPFVPRPSLVPDPVTAFGKKKPQQEVKLERKSILSAEERAKIKPKAYLEPVKPYVSARGADQGEGVH
ncbi:hypothetical protein NQ315_007315 [Exocentrus adspersus]|uniref:Testicular haploid expressed protein n=1 Tax=Exocentrus adspersus TaxID=1586481 RepID=A0AAV8WE81_9CUCU|nr:hypothetical protein NQ315_007315 [Exocentrus adspersus]